MQNGNRIYEPQGNKHPSLMITDAHSQGTLLNFAKMKNDYILIRNIFSKNLRWLLSLVILALAALWVYKLLNIKNYQARLFQRTYFSLINGYSYDLGDTVFIEKGVADTNNFRIRVTDLLDNKEYPMTHSTKKTFDLSLRKFYELNGSITTDYFVPEKSSIYLMELASNDELFYDIFFVNNKKSETTALVKVVLSNYTWTAYNTFGGRSNYKDIVTPFAVRLFKKYHQNRQINYFLNLYKPNELNNSEIQEWIKDGRRIAAQKRYHSVVAELPLIQFLWKKFNGMIEIMDCHEFENYCGPRRNRLFVFNGHSEYWSDRMIGQLQNLKHNNNILLFSGNNMYRKIKIENRSIFVTENLINPEITARITGLASTRDGLEKNSCYYIVNPEHFLTRNIKCKEIGGDWAVSLEADVLHSSSPSQAELLATGKNRPCDLVLLPQGNGYYLLNFGSIGAYHGMDDSCFVRLLDNFVNYAISRESLSQ